MQDKTLERTCVAFPRVTTHVKAIARALGANITKIGMPADFLILQQCETDGGIDLRSLNYFRTSAFARAQTVVLIPSLKSASSLGFLHGRNADGPGYVHAVNAYDADSIAKLQVFATSVGRDGAVKDTANRTNRAEPYLGLLRHAVGARNNDTLTNALKELKEHFPEVTVPDLGSMALDGLYYYLSRLTQGYAEQAHDLNRIDGKLSDTLTDERVRSALGRRAAAKHVLAAAEALRESLAGPGIVQSDGPFKILVIDDDSSGENKLPAYASQLTEVARAFFPKPFEIYFWNPAQTDNERTAFNRLCSYGSLEQQNVGELQLHCKLVQQPPDGAGGMPKPDLEPKAVYCSLDDIANGFDYVLVDQLYCLESYGTTRQQTVTGHGHVLGPAAIRGLRRVFHDITGSSPGGHRLPQVIAVSRDDDPSRIQDAIRSGARDYILKSQLLRLPAVMSKVQLSVGEVSDAPHRNFPELFRLPAETQGLLRSVLIPRTGPLHRNRSKSAPAPSEDAAAKMVSGLLEAFPKTDLHVHAGSCMAPEFLVVASAVGLVRVLALELRKSRDCDANGNVGRFEKDVARTAGAFRALAGLDKATTRFTWEPAIEIAPGVQLAGNGVSIVANGPSWVMDLGEIVRRWLQQQLERYDLRDATESNWAAYQSFRAFLHRECDVRDRLSTSEANAAINQLTDFDASLFALRWQHGLELAFADKGRWTKDDLIRIYLLTLAARYQGSSGWASLQVDGHDILKTFRSTLGGASDRGPNAQAWDALRNAFYPAGIGKALAWSIRDFRKSGWQLHRLAACPLRLDLRRPARREERDYEPPSLGFEDSPIEYTLATGLRSHDLVGYLEGCELSGAEHLRHPFLIHLYAQQVVLDLVRRGVFYAELRASPDGYADSDFGFEFPHVCRAMEEAFSNAQEKIFQAWGGTLDHHNDLWIADILGQDYTLKVASEQLKNMGAPRRFPCKVSLIYVGKRHKSTREMILEAAAAAVMRPPGEKTVRSAHEFAEREMTRCRVVGFDLAGKEVGNPPERFVEDFARLSRLHIPLTVHAGENESFHFVEDSILRLHARRIGHGLSLEEDPGLLARVREDRVGIELCPISNFQTSHFGPPGSARPYPLRKLIDSGILVSINTDNPIISYTNIVREFFQASWAWDERGMTLWDALRLIRMGFVMSFLNQQERRALLEIAGQFLVDLFSSEATVETLRELARMQRQPVRPSAGA